MKRASLHKPGLIWSMMFLFLVLAACNYPEKKVDQSAPPYSSNQRYLFKLLDDYKKQYYTSKNEWEKQMVQFGYQDKMKRFLVDSLRRYIDSMTVLVDTVIDNKLLVTTQFHTRDIEFKYSMQFQQDMPPSGDSMYHFTKGFIPGQQVRVGFVHLGGGELNYLGDKSKRIMRIFAYPVPISSSK